MVVFSSWWVGLKQRFSEVVTPPAPFPAHRVKINTDYTNRAEVNTDYINRTRINTDYTFRGRVNTT